MPLTVGDVARQLGCRPRDVSDLFYARVIDDKLCPVVAGRRLIPDNFVERIAAALRKAGKLSRATKI